MNDIDPFDLNDIQDEFAAKWNSGKRPNIQEFLGRVDKDRRVELLGWLLPEDILHRFHLGEFPNASDYEQLGIDAVELAKTEIESERDRFIPRKIGRYIIRSGIDKGGMGIVYEAELSEPNSPRVALKVLHSHLMNETGKARFEREYSILKSLDHPNIAKVFEYGKTDDGRHFIAMELVSTTNIVEYCDSRRLGIRDRLALLLQVCSAILHAHEKLVLHRDIKPSNVLVASIDNTPIVKVIDFGLAKILSATGAAVNSLTVLGFCVGTPLYMSPEQADVDVALSSLTIRSDIYSLGVVLHELIVGVTPIDNKLSVPEVLVRLTTEDPELASKRVLSVELTSQVFDSRRTNRMKLKRELRSHLDWIIQKALERDHAKRFATVAEFADEIQRYLNNQPPIHAKPPTKAMRLWAFAQRNRVTLLFIVVVTSLSMLGLAATYSQLIRAWKAEQIAVEGKRESEKKLSRIYYNSAITRWNEGRQNEALDLLHKVGKLHRGLEWRIAHCQFEGGVIVKGDKDITCFTLSADGELLVTGSSDSTITIWSKKTGEMIHTLNGHSGRVNSVAISKNANQILSGSADKSVRLWNALTGRAIRVVGRHDSEVTTVNFVCNDQYAVSGGLKSQNENLRLWNIEGKEAPPAFDRTTTKVFKAPAPPRTFPNDATESNESDKPSSGFYPGILVCCVNSDGSLILTGNEESILEVWDATNGRRVKRLQTSRPRCACFSPDNKRIVFGGDDRNLRTVSTAPGPFRKTLSSTDGSDSVVVETDNDQEVLAVLDGGITSVHFCAGGEKLVVGSVDKSVRILDAATGKVINLLKRHRSEVREAFFDRSGRFITSAEIEGVIGFWDSFSSDAHITIMAETYSLEPWYRKTFQENEDESLHNPYNSSETFESLTPCGEGVHCVAYLPGGSQFAAGHESGGISIYDSMNGELIHNFFDHSEVRILAISSDGSLIANSSGGRGVRVRRLRSREIVFDIHTSSEVSCIAICPVSNWIAVGSTDGCIGIWDIVTGAKLQSFRGQLKGVTALSFNHDGSMLISGSIDKTVILWDVKNGNELQRYDAHAGTVNAVIHDRHSDSIISCGADKTIKIWSLRSRKITRILNGHKGSVKTIALSQDGKNVVSGGNDKTVRIWDLESGEELRVLSEHRSPVLSIAIRADGTQMVSSGADSSIKLWFANEDATKDNVESFVKSLTDPVAP